MAGVSAVGAAGGAQFQAEYQVRVLKLGKDAINEQGQRALELIQSATVDPQSGQNLNVSI